MAQGRLKPTVEIDDPIFESATVKTSKAPQIEFITVIALQLIFLSLKLLAIYLFIFYSNILFANKVHSITD